MLLTIVSLGKYSNGGETMANIKKTIAMWLLNYALKSILSSEVVQAKQKQLIALMNAVIDALRDKKITEDEIADLNDRLSKLFSRD